MQTKDSQQKGQQKEDKKNKNPEKRDPRKKANPIQAEKKPHLRRDRL
jgi:hypothetical protein